MEYIVKDKSIELEISAANSGKFRFKKRENRLDFGETFSTREGCFDERSYLEWQIGYDVLVKDIKKGEKRTKLIKRSFTGDKLVYAINQNNVQNLSSLMKIFGMASKRHNHDIIQIIQTLLALMG